MIKQISLKLRCISDKKEKNKFQSVSLIKKRDLLSISYVNVYSISQSRTPDTKFRNSIDVSLSHQYVKVKRGKNCTMRCIPVIYVRVKIAAHRRRKINEIHKTGDFFTSTSVIDY